MAEFIFWPIYVLYAYVFGTFHASVITSALTICHVCQRHASSVSTIDQKLRTVRREGHGETIQSPLHFTIQRTFPY
jgi:hypothetical protein